MRALKLTIGIAAMLAAFMLAARDNTSQVGGGMLTSTRSTSSPSATPVVQQVPTATPQPPDAHPVYILDPRNGELLSQILVIDADARREVLRTQTRYEPKAAFSPDGRRLYVADSYQTRVTRGEWVDALSAYDPETLSLLVDDVPISKRLLYKMFPGSEHWFFPSSDGRNLFISKYGDPDIHQLQLGILETTSFKTVAEFTPPVCSVDHFWSLPDGRLICLKANAVYIVDTRTGALQKELEVNTGEVATWALLAPTGDRFYVFSNAHVAIVDVTRSRLELLDVRPIVLPSAIQIGSGNSNTLSPDGTRLYVGLFPTGGENFSKGVMEEIWVYDTRTWQRLDVLRLSDPAWDFAVSTDGRQLYTVNPFTKTLGIYDTGNFHAIALMHDVGVTPAQILIRPR